MKKKLSRVLATMLAILTMLSCIAVGTIPASAATYRNGAQSGPSASYASGRYYRNYQRLNLTGDNRTDLIAIALSQLGYQEGAANGAFSGEVSGGANYVEFSYNMGDLGLGYGGSDYPWCASFVSWCLYQSRCTNHSTYSYLCRNHSGDYNYIWKEISCAMWVNQLKGAGYFSYSAGMGGSYTPKYGDLVFFKSSSSPSHIGICLYVKDGVLYTVEGNTSDASGLETNGGGVYFKSYSLSSSYLYGFGRLPYGSDSSVTKVDYSGASPTPGQYISNAAKYIYSSEYATSAITTIPRFSMFDITKVGANNRLYGTFTDVNGSTVTGWIENNSSRILQLNCSGVMSGSWEKDANGFRYRYSDGSYASQGWLQDPENSAWYYIGANGYAQNGWLYLSNGTFYLDTNSNAMLTGHRYIDGRWYYFNNDGFLCDGAWEWDGTGTRYRYVDGTYGANCWLDDATNGYARYYLDANGYSVGGWQMIDGTWYYFDTGSHAMLKGAIFINNNWYYLDENGAMQTGWVEYEGNMYYFDSSGARVQGTTVDINGSTCTFDENGVLVEGTIIEDTETPTMGGGYDSYTQGMAANGVGAVYAHGIDISKWNNGDDWTTLKLNLAAVKAAGIDFVIMRCGSTNKGKDPMFEMYYAECKRLGLDVGAYFYSYALDAASAVSDANKCLSYIQGKQFEYPIYMDFEDPTQESIGGTLSGEICKAFLDTVASGGYLTGIYSYKSWLEMSWVTNYGLRDRYEAWAAYPVKSQNHAAYDVEMSQKFGMYQYTFEYVIPNAGTFDANVCYKDYPTIVKTYGFNNYTPSSAGDNLSASWVQDDYGFRYMYSNGTYAGPGWLLDPTNNAWYYLDSNGYAVSGWIEDNGKTYYLDPNTNAMFTGHHYIDNKWYYFDSSGAMANGGMWVQDSTGFKFQMSDGSFVYSGWIDEPNSGARYYLDANGYAVHGWQTIDGTLYYFDPSSNALLKGWLSVDNKTYCTAADGAILKGFQYIDGKYFYFDESTGAMQTGFVTFGDKWYYFNTTDGTMITGWFSSPKTGYIYYFNNEGEMANGVYEQDGNLYFFEDNPDNHYGQLLTGKITSTEGKSYYAGADGILLTGWQEMDGNTYYFNPATADDPGVMLTGVHTIDEKTYAFDNNGVLVGMVVDPSAPDETEPTEPTEPSSYSVTWEESDTYTVNAATEAAAGEDFNFTVEAAEGYEISTVIVNMDKLTDTDGIYTVTDVHSDIEIIVVTTEIHTPDTTTYHTVAFVDMDGKIISLQAVKDGEGATAPADPTRPADAQYTYTFTGWDKTFDNITEDTIITAEYSTITNTYTVTFVGKDGSILSTQTINYGEAAVAPSAPVVSGYTFMDWDKNFSSVTGNLTVTAQYTKNPVSAAVGTLKIEIVAGRGFLMQINDGASRPQGPSYMNTSAPVGAKITVTAVTADSNEFVAWVNPANGQIVSTDPTFTFYFSGNDFYKAMYKIDFPTICMVTFMHDKANQQWDMQYYSAGESISFPTVDPESLGYEFKGWNMTEAEIQAAIAAGNDVTVLPVWEKILTYVDITVDGGMITASGGTNAAGQYLAGGATVVTANAAPSGQKFAYWVDGDGNIRSYSTEYRFYPDKETKLTAVFVAENTTIEYRTIVSVDTFTPGTYGSFTVSWYVPAKENNLTFIGGGIIAVNKDFYNEDTFVHGTTDTNVWDRTGSTTETSSTYVWTGPVASGQTWYAKAWAQYKTASGELQTVYSDMFTATKD